MNDIKLFVKIKLSELLSNKELTNKKTIIWLIDEYINPKELEAEFINKDLIYYRVNDYYINLYEKKLFISASDRDADVLLLDKSMSPLEISKISSRVSSYVFVRVNNPKDILSLKGAMLDGFLIYYDRSLNEYIQNTNKILFNSDKYDLYIVDYDGTICDTMPMWRNVYKEFLDYEGVVTDKNVFSMVTKLTNVEIVALLQREFFKELSLELVADKFFSFLDKKYLECKAKPGAMELLDYLSKRGRVVLYSATREELIRKSLKKLKLIKYYDAIYSGSDLNLSKGDGSGYLKILELESGCLYPLVLEDAMHAIAGANRAGLDVMAIYDDYNYESFEEIIPLSKYFINLNRKDKL